MELRFVGKITSGINKHVELYVPGRDDLPQAPSDWPTLLQPGSLNIKINPEGYPRYFEKNGLENTTKSLDESCCPCTFEIQQSQFGNNRLTPKFGMPNRGTGKVWRATLQSNGHNIDCWVLRRYGSGLADKLEIVSDKYLRQEFGFRDGDEALILIRS